MLAIEMSENKSQDPRLNVRVDADTRKRIKRVSVETGKSITDLVGEWVAAGIAAAEAELARKPEEGKKGGVVYAMGGLSAMSCADRKG